MDSEVEESKQEWEKIKWSRTEEVTEPKEQAEKKEELAVEPKEKAEKKQTNWRLNLISGPETILSRSPPPHPTF